MGPLPYDGSGYPCKLYAKSPVIATLGAGETLTVELHGKAPHGGGHCEFSVSYDEGKTFVVIKQIIHDCMTKDELNYDVDLPEDLPSCDSCIFAWTWVNAIGNREYYMNCADVSIESSSTGPFTGPMLTITNQPGYPYIPEFPDPGDYDGADLFASGKTVTVSSNGESSSSVPPKATSSAKSGKAAAASNSASKATATSKSKSSSSSSGSKAKKGGKVNTKVSKKVVVASDNEDGEDNTATDDSSSNSDSASSNSKNQCTPSTTVCSGAAAFKVCIPSPDERTEWVYSAPFACSAGHTCKVVNDVAECQ